MRVHPVADLFPMLSEDELADLAADIKANGLIHPIVLDAKGETLIDGRNRLEACKRAGIEPRFNRLNGEDPWAYTISANVKRRNLTPGQRAYAAAMAWTAAEAEGRVQKSGARSDRPNGKIPSGLIAKPGVHFAKQFGSNEKYIRLVRDLLAPVDDGGDPAAARRTALGQALPARPPIATSGATSPRARRRAYAAAMAWTAAEAEGRVQQGAGRIGKLAKSSLISDPRAYFAKQFGSNEKYVRLVRDLLAPAAELGRPWRRTDE